MPIQWKLLQLLLIVIIILITIVMLTTVLGATAKGNRSSNLQPATATAKGNLQQQPIDTQCKVNLDEKRS